MEEIIRQGKSPEVIFSTFDLSNNFIKELLIKAIEARNMGNQPVSKFHVGAALEIEGNSTIYTGSNYENVNFNGTTHAEQDAINTALKNRKNKEKYDNITISKLAIAGGLKDTTNFDITNFSIKSSEDILQTIGEKDLERIMKEFVTPCGHCRQIYDAFIGENTEIFLINSQGMVAKIKNPKTLMPFGFSKIG